MSSDFDVNWFCRILSHEAPDAVIYADREGIIQFWNTGAQRIFGFSEGEATGKSLDIIIPRSLRARHWARFNETMRTDKTRYRDGDILAVPAVRQNGARISIEFAVLPFQDQAGQMVGIAAILRDVTRRFERNESPAPRTLRAPGQLIKMLKQTDPRRLHAIAAGAEAARRHEIVRSLAPGENP